MLRHRFAEVAFDLPLTLKTSVQQLVQALAGLAQADECLEGSGVGTDVPGLGQSEVTST
ncbi:hypothetical protein [Streptomyces sp. NPDC048187]|uniref:hypothetical protein n=1 Tax=Streptomyces sp. NPDC048187 TaxID=3365509 RepID=UPI00371C2741